VTTVIRPAQAADAAALADLEVGLFGPEAWSSTSVEEQLSVRGRRVLLAVTPDDEIVGYAFTMLSGDHVDLLRIGVVPERRRRGVAGRLLEESRRLAGLDGADRMLLEVSAGNSAARAFYAAAGFVQIDQRSRYYKDGSDGLVLRVAVGSSACGGRGARENAGEV
jgi:ribosomal protein S18 acetylase RimI-like enzyme